MRPLVVTLTNFDAFIEFNHNITPEIFQHIESHIYRAVDKDLTEAILKFIKSVTLNHNIDLNFAQNILPPLRHVIPNNDYQDVNEEYCVIVLECLINLIKKDSLHLNTFLSLKFTDFLKRRIDDQRFTRHILIFIGLYTQKFPQSMLSLGISIDSIYKHICVEDSSFDAALWCFYYIIESDHILLESENTMKIIDYLFEKFDGNGYFVKRYIVLLIALVYKHIPTSEYDKDKVIKILDMFTEVAEMGTDEERREMFKYLVQTVCSIYRVYENCPKEEIDDQFMQCLATLISGAEDLGENELCETLNKMMQECTDE
ncbi:hypothetical protein GPJ56_004112 [Histomonas meleagridis]|uniref:uncharacterized protein n=1 Tax=Histomonas meleagridis TaxID=135588 RepID=UPI0035596C50|nr:hypothetical protein GPJ56_004112 [Histomonas meleagridis]KAH0801453.1 hypothetical protein GO595_005705 [Histomonas meleagridis]